MVLAFVWPLDTLREALVAQVSRADARLYKYRWQDEHRPRPRKSFHTYQSRNLKSAMRMNYPILIPFRPDNVLMDPVPPRSGTIVVRRILARHPFNV